MAHVSTLDSISQILLSITLCLHGGDSCKWVHLTAHTSLGAGTETESSLLGITGKKADTLFFIPKVNRDEMGNAQ